MIGELLGWKPPSNRRRRRSSEAVSLWASLQARVPAVLRRSEPKQAASDLDMVEPPRVMLSRVGAWVAALVCVAMVAGVALSFDQYTARTQHFVVSDIEVNGNQRIPWEDIVAASGVESGSPLLAVSTVAVRERLEALAWVKRAEAQPILPSRLVIHVVEFEPVAMVAAGELLLIDADGVLFDQVKAGDKHDLPLLSGLPVDALRRGSKAMEADVLLQRKRLRLALAVLSSVQASPIASTFSVGEVHWDPVQGMTLISQQDGAEVRLGHRTSDALPRQLEQLGRLLADVEQRGERLRYALMDDERRPERATIHVAKAGTAVALPAGLRRRRVGGATAPPQAEQRRDAGSKSTNHTMEPEA